MLRVRMFFSGGMFLRRRRLFRLHESFLCGEIGKEVAGKVLYAATYGLEVCAIRLLSSCAFKIIQGVVQEGAKGVLYVSPHW